MKELLKNVTNEQMERLSVCQTAAEILTLTEQFGVNMNNEQADELLSLFKTRNDEIDDDMLETVTGGISLGYRGVASAYCPLCFQTGLNRFKGEYQYFCSRCRYYFNEALPYPDLGDTRTDKSGRFA